MAVTNTDKRNISAARYVEVQEMEGWSLTTHWTNLFHRRRELCTQTFLCFLFFIFRGHTWWRMEGPTCPLWGRLYSRFSHSLFGSTSPVVLRLWLRELELWWLQWSWVKWICELSVLVCQCHWASGFTLQRCDIALLTGLSEMQSVSFYYYYCVISLFFFFSGETGTRWLTSRGEACLPDVYDLIGDVNIPILITLWRWSSDASAHPVSP